MLDTNRGRVQKLSGKIRKIALFLLQIEALNKSKTQIVCFQIWLIKRFSDFKKLIVPLCSWSIKIGDFFRKHCYKLDFKP